MLRAERLMPVCLAGLVVQSPTLLGTPAEVASICPRCPALVANSCRLGGSGARTGGVTVVARLMLLAERLMPICLGGLAVTSPAWLVTPLEDVGVGGWVKMGTTDRADNAWVEVFRGGGLGLVLEAGVMSLEAEAAGLLGKMRWVDRLGGSSPTVTPVMPAAQHAFDI